MPPGDPATYLYVDRTGTFVGLDDVIADGLDHDYSHRHLGLEVLMRTGEPLHRLHACMMLASWGRPAGLLTLIEWAHAPHDTPWAAEPVTYDRLFGTDDAFALLTHALITTRDVALTEVGTVLRRQATRDLLLLSDRWYVERSMGLLLGSVPGLARECRPELDRAVERTIAAARRHPAWLPRQAAFLLAPLAEIDDDAAADAATALVDDHPDHEWALREVALSLREGTGPATLAVLDRLADWHLASVRIEAVAHREARVPGELAAILRSWAEALNRLPPCPAGELAGVLGVPSGRDPVFHRVFLHGPPGLAEVWVGERDGAVSGLEAEVRPSSLTRRDLDAALGPGRPGTPMPHDVHPYVYVVEVLGEAFTCTVFASLAGPAEPGREVTRVLLRRDANPRTFPSLHVAGDHPVRLDRAPEGGFAAYPLDLRSGAFVRDDAWLPRLAGCPPRPEEFERLVTVLRRAASYDRGAGQPNPPSGRGRPG
jgi:hypothetical protein